VLEDLGIDSGEVAADPVVADGCIAIKAPFGSGGFEPHDVFSSERFQIVDVFANAGFQRIHSADSLATRSTRPGRF
jgi:hypothetical protein